MSQEYSVINFLIKSRLLFNTDREYCELLGMKIDSFRKRYEDKPSEELDELMRRFDNECLNQCGYSALYAFNAYQKASEVCADQDFWGSWRQKASRKRFCRWMFQKAYLKFSNLYGSDIMEATDEAVELLHRFKPDLDDNPESIDIVLTILFTFGVIKPYTADTGKFSDYKNISENMENLIELLEIINKDLPSLGIYEKNKLITTNIEILRKDYASGEVLTAARLWKVFDEVALSLSPQESPKERADSRITFGGYAMNGIWIDDSEDKKERFWIFPDNKLMAFCYANSECGWTLRPYEFSFYRLDYEEEFGEVCTMVTVKGNEQILFGGFVGDEEIQDCYFDLHFDEEKDGRLDKIKLISQTDKYPDWMKWRSFSRLPEESDRYKVCSEVIDSLYNADSEMLSESLRKHAPWMTDNFNCLIGMDRDYLYVSAFFGVVPHILKRRDNDDVWEYVPRDESIFDKMNLPSVEISADKPIYAIPRSERLFSKIDEKFNVNNLRSMYLQKKAGMVGTESFQDYMRDERCRYTKFKECACSTDMDDQITIYSVERNPLGDVMCFNRFSTVIPIADLEKYGVVKICSRKTFGLS